MTRLKSCSCAALLLSAVLWPAPVSADGSLICIYHIMTSVRVAMDLCGDRLDSVSVLTYSNLRSDLKTFINQNARLPEHRIEADYDERLQRHLDNRADTQRDTQGTVPFCGHQ